MDAPKSLRCGSCGCEVRRPYHEPPRSDVPEVYTRTLVYGEFLPSCSEECAARLRAKTGLRRKGNGS